MTPKELMKYLYKSGPTGPDRPTSPRVEQLLNVSKAYAMLDMDLVDDLVTQTYEQIPKLGENDREFILRIIQGLIDNECLALEQQASRALAAKNIQDS